MIPDVTRSYLRNVISSCLADVLPADDVRIDVANKVEEAVTRLFAVKPCDIGGLDPMPENMLAKYEPMIDEGEGSE